jgi:hypothetical protein
VDKRSALQKAFKRRAPAKTKEAGDFAGLSLKTFARSATD